VRVVADLPSNFKINFENISKTNINIAKELEKRAAFSEECAKILLNQNENTNADFHFFMSLINSEKSKIAFSDIKKNIIDENIFLCEYIFKSIKYADLFSAYSVYISDNLPDLGNIDLNKKIDMRIKLTEKFSFNDFIQYASLFDFDILNLNYNGDNNLLNFIFKLKIEKTEYIKEKQKILAVFTGLIAHFGITEIAVFNAK